MPRIQFGLKTILWITLAGIAIALVVRHEPGNEYETAALGWLCAILIVVAAAAK